MRLKELREEMNLTQNEVAQAIQTSQSNIGRWEKGLNEPAASYLIKLANLFEVSIDYLLGVTEEDDFGNITIKKEKSAEISPDGKELLDIFNALEPEHQLQVLEYARYFATRSGINKKKA